MSFAVVLEQILRVHEPSAQIYDLIKILSKQELQAVLTAVGKTHMQAGFRAVNDAKTSSAPEEQLRDARVCFRTAFEFFAEKKGGIFGFFSQPDYENMYQAALLVALCNTCFGDRTNAHRYTDLAYNAFEEYYSIKDNELSPSGYGRTRAASYVGTLSPKGKRLRAELEAERDAIKSLSRKLKT